MVGSRIKLLVINIAGLRKCLSCFLKVLLRGCFFRDQREAITSDQSLYMEYYCTPQFALVAEVLERLEKEEEDKEKK
jgi:hypothetical protein